MANGENGGLISNIIRIIITVSLTALVGVASLTLERIWDMSDNISSLTTKVDLFVKESNNYREIHKEEHAIFRVNDAELRRMLRQLERDERNR